MLKGGIMTWWRNDVVAFCQNGVVALIITADISLGCWTECWHLGETFEMAAGVMDGSC